jgi:hypothetical protein
MIMVMKRRNLFGYFLAFCILIGMASCAGREKKPVTPKIKYSVAPEAKVTNFEYYLDEKCKIAKKPCLTVKMTVKNVSNEPLRFISRITLPKEGKSVGGFVPRKGKKDKVTKKRLPPEIAPGKEEAVKYPMFQYEIPKRIEVEVIPMR